MSKRLAGKTAIVTGSSTGIGKACARRFAEEGARVVVNGSGRNPADGPEVVREIIEGGGEAVYFEADVRDREALEGLIRFGADTYGGIDILVNNAVTGTNAELLEQKDDGWDSMYASTIKAIYVAGKLAIPAMIKAGGGSIINLSSVHGMLAGRNQVAYATFKGAILNMTRQMAVDYGKYNVRVNALCPARIVTERKVGFLAANPVEYRRQKAVYPLGRPGTLEEIANAALFLASGESSFVTGHALVVDGGLTAQIQDSVAIPLEAGITEELGERGVRWPGSC